MGASPRWCGSRIVLSNANFLNGCIFGVDTIPADVARKLGYYVYLYVNPADDQVLYVGKGKGRRAAVHLKDGKDSRKIEAIRAIRRTGAEPRIEILAHGLPNEEAALRLEAAAIDLLGLPRLTNEVRGWRSTRLGRMLLRQLVAAYRKKPVQIREAAMLIRINQLYRPTMSAVELYDVTRSAWVVGSQRRAQVKYAVAVFEGIVREIYDVIAWMPEGATLRTSRPSKDRAKKRWEFVGRLAPEQLRRRYIDRYVGDQFPQGAQNPIRYVGITSRTPKTVPTIAPAAV